MLVLGTQFVQGFVFQRPIIVGSQIKLKQNSSWRRFIMTQIAASDTTIGLLASNKRSS